MQFKTEAFQAMLDETQKSSAGKKLKSQDLSAILTEWRKMVCLTNSRRENDHPYGRRLLDNVIEQNIDILRAYRHRIFLVVAGHAEKFV